MRKAFLSLCLMSLTWGSFLGAEESSLKIKTILLQSPEADDRVASSPGVSMVGLDVPGGEGKLIATLEPFLEKSFSEESLLQIKTEILAYYAKASYPYVAVEIPEQEITEGRVRYVVLDGRVDQISFTGNRWFSDKNLSRYIHIRPGDSINQDQLLSDIASMNRNPFHFSEVVLGQSEKRNWTDVEIHTQDRFPLRVFGGVDNTGNSFTGNTRNYAGFNWGNAFFIDDLLTYQFTMANQYHRFWSHFGNYTSYLSWGHTLFLYGGYSAIHPHIPDFKSEGKSYQGSLRYTVSFKPYYTAFTHELNFGVDIKGMNTNLFFSDQTGDIPVSTHLANLSQLVLSYHLRYKTPRYRLSMELDWVGSPVEWMANQNKKRFNEIRPDALPLYTYGRLYLENDWALVKNRLTVATNIRLQGATKPLMPSEQMGLGGYNTVRGYDEQAFNSDTAVCANVELRLSPLKTLKDKRILTFLAFADYGLGHNFKNDSSIPSTEYLLSAGPGIRYEMYPYLSLRADYGFKFHTFVNSGPGRGKFHFSATASF